MADPSGISELQALLTFTVPGIHTEKLDSRNQEWDTKVRERVREATRSVDLLQIRQTYTWFAVHVKWFVAPASYSGHNPDLDNLRLKPVLDSLTRLRFWKDDNILFVRRIVSDAELVSSRDEQRVEVSIFGLQQDKS